MTPLVPLELFREFVERSLAQLDGSDTYSLTDWLTQFESSLRADVESWEDET